MFFRQTWKSSMFCRARTQMCNVNVCVRRHNKYICIYIAVIAPTLLLLTLLIRTALSLLSLSLWLSSSLSFSHLLATQLPSSEGENSKNWEENDARERTNCGVKNEFEKNFIHKHTHAQTHIDVRDVPIKYLLTFLVPLNNTTEREAIAGDRMSEGGREIHSKNF